MTLLTSESIDCVEFPTLASSERRRGLRIAQARPIKVYEPQGARYFGGQTEDISVTGLRIELPASAPLAVGSTISVHVGSLPNRRQMIPARVVWVDRSFGRDYTIAGIEFITSIAAALDAA